MLETVFIGFLAGCAHDATDCVALHRVEIRAESQAACEVVIDEMMARETAEFPEYLGLCRRQDLLAGDPLPVWWTAAQPLGRL